jgi:hypothetical protein
MTNLRLNSCDNRSLSPDQAAALDFLVQLRTRMASEPLPFQHGVEARALASLYELFGHARDAMERHPGCRHFACAVTEMLNVELRPFLAKWHAEGRLNARCIADKFRADLAPVQERLRDLVEKLYDMAR